MIQNSNHEQKSNLQYIYNAMEEGVCFHEMVYDQQGNPSDYRIIDINPAYERILGLKKEEVMGKLASQIYGCDEPPHLTIFSEVVREGKPFTFETYFEPLDIHFRVMASSHLKDSFITIFTDISFHKRMVGKLREKIDQMDAINQNVPFVLWKTGIDEEGNFTDTFISDSIDEFLALPPHSINHDISRFLSLIRPEYKRTVAKAIQEGIDNPGKMYSVEYAIDKEDGTVAWFFTSGKTVHSNGTLQSYGTTIDITQRKIKEKAYEETSEVLRSILESTNNGILVLDENGKLLSMNETFIQLWEIPEVMTISSRLNDRYLIDYAANKLIDPDQFIKTIRDLQTNSLDKFWNTLYFKDNRIFDLYSQPLFINKKAKGRVLVFTDVTSRRKAEYALKESEAKFRSYIDNSPEGIFVADDKGRYVEVNKAACDMTGYSEAELLEMGLMDITSLIRQVHI